MAQTLTIDDIPRVRSVPLYTSDGEQFGHVGDVYYDEDTRELRWLSGAAGFLNMRRVWFPARGAEFRDDGVYVAYTRDQLRDAPDIETEELSDREIGRLNEYYGRYHEKADREEVLRSEEELQVGKRETEAGRARVRKWVETEPVSMDVELQRETARLTREPIEQPVGEAELGEEEVEVPLRAEEPVVQKQAVAKERVGVEKDVETERKTVGGEVRKERVEVEGDDVETR